MIEVHSHARGAVLPVRARAGARTTGIIGERAHRLLVAVRQPPEKGRANQAIRALLADAFHLPVSGVELLTGAGHRDKRFLVHGVDSADLSAMVATICRPATDDS